MAHRSWVWYHGRARKRNKRQGTLWCVPSYLSRDAAREDRVRDRRMMQIGRYEVFHRRRKRVRYDFW